MLHLTKGLDAPALPPPAIVTILLKGQENFEQIKEKNKKEQRISVTVPVMKLLKRRI